MKNLIKIITVFIIFFFISTISAIEEKNNTDKSFKNIQKNRKYPNKLKNNQAYVPNQIIIKLKQNKTLEDISTLNIKHRVFSSEKIFKKEPDFKKNLNKRVKRAVKNIPSPQLNNIYILKINETTNLDSILKEYSSHSAVEYAQPNHIYKIQMIPNDPYFSSRSTWGQSYDDLWGLKKIDCAKAWDISQGEGIVVAVVDTGIDYNHEDIADNIWKNNGEIPENRIDDDTNGFIDDFHGWDFVNTSLSEPIQDNNPKDGYGHGTHVAGIIAGVGYNYKGIIGTAPFAKVMAVKGLDDTDGAGDDETLSNAIKYAVDNGADIINNSWGSFGQDKAIEDVINYAISKGCIVVAAAGNSDMNVIKFYPANIPDVISVSAIDENDKKCYFSNFGFNVDISAPGGNDNILSLLASDSYLSRSESYKDSIIGNKYIRLQGTSMATPYVSGVAALLLANDSTLNVKTVRAKIIASSVNINNTNPGYESKLGGGSINAYNALTIDEKPFLKIDSVTSFESIGDNDGILEKDETGKLIIGLKNIFKNASVVTAVLSSNSPYISIITSYIDYNSIANNQTKDNTINPFQFKIIKDFTEEINVLFTLSLNIDGNTQIFYPRINLGTKEITKNYSVESYDINKNKIVWIDYRNDSSNIYHYDFKTKEEKRINRNSFQKQSPVVYNNKIVWSDLIDDTNYANTHIYVYDLDINQEKQITSNFSLKLNPKIHDNKIVWMDNYNSNSFFDFYIYVYDLDTNQKKQITNNSTFYPSIYGNKIVYEGYRDNNWDIYLFNLETNNEKRITTDLSEQWAPIIFENKIVYHDNRNGNWDIYLFDLDANKEIQITTDSSDQISPAIFKDKICWEDYRNENADIYFYDLKTKQEKQITTNPMNDISPAVYGNKIIWKTNDQDIYYINYTNDATTIVMGEGSRTASLTSLKFYFFSDLESEILEYQYKITQNSINGILIKDWTSVGNNELVIVDGLNLEKGKTYYCSVKAKNTDGVWSDVGYSNGVLVNSSPKLNPIGDKTINANVKLNFTVSAQDPDNDTLTYSIQNLPKGATFNSSNGIFLWNSTKLGTYIVTFTVSDGLFYDSQGIIIKVENLGNPNVNTNNNSSNSKKCFLTVLFKPGFENKINNLTQFRDVQLLSNYFGNILTKIYYTLSPKLLK